MAVEKAAVFWNVTPRSSLPTFWRYLLPQPSRYGVESSCLKIEASGYSTTLVTLCLNTRHHIQEHSNLEERMITELN